MSSAEVVEEILNRYEIIVAEKIAMQNESYRHIDKEVALTNQLEELSRTITILRKTLKCHDDFLDDGDLRADYEKFKDKWIAEQEEKRNEQSNLNG